MGGFLSLVRAPAVAFLGSFLVFGGWFWAPQLLKLMPSFSSGVSSGASSAPPSAGSGGSWFADANRLGRPETAPVLRTCLVRLSGGASEKVDPNATYSMLKASSMQASMSAFAGRSPAWAGNRALSFAAAWGELATCIYSQDDRELCDPDNRAAMVEATTKFFGFARQMETSKPPVTAEEARIIGNFGDQLLNALKNHARYGSLVAGDFGSFASPEITRIMREEKQTRDICKKR
jgi:hypothetical protein